MQTELIDIEVRTVQILLPLPFNEPFSYIIPNDMELSIGNFVVVPFRNRDLYGVVWNFEKNDTPLSKTKYVIKKIGVQPLTDKMIKFVSWVANYTISPLGMVLKMAIHQPALVPQKPILEYILDTSKLTDTKLSTARKNVTTAINDKQSRSIKAIATIAAVSENIVRAMIKAGYFSEVAMLPKYEQERYNITHLELQKEQQQAADIMIQMINDNKYQAAVLDGVTGSGKTEVYLAAVEEVLKRDTGQVLILLPEIVLTTQLLNRFERRFNCKPTIWHSSLTPANRRENWRKISEGNARLIIGARSALFMPYHDLRLIIVDEEHEASFKQEEGVIYHGRDMAVLRANIENIPIILASATPSIETMVNIKEGRFKHIKLRERYGDAVMPDIHIIDMRNEKLKYGNWISRSLKDMVASNLDSGKQSMLFLNRRGYAPLVLCTDCGHRINCNSCSTSLVYHQGKGHDYLQCHHCGFTCDMIKECPECKAKEDKIIKCGPGVERLRDEASELFPEARIAMLTSDTTANANKTSDLIKEITAGEYDIIIGTQMVAKGHHFPNLTLVGIVDADMEMSGGDPRTAERSYQILHQVAGRAGRESEKGTVLIQSYMPDSDILKSVMNYDRDRFIEHEIKMRKIRSMPPFSRLTLLIISGNNEIDVVSTARELSRHADFGNKFEIMGPIPAPLYQVQGKFRYHTLIKADRKLNIQKMIKHWISKIKIPNNVNIKVDIDPYNFI